ncbi:MAG: S-methyl-5-thioribose-1-phosphate isomerase [Thermoleophilia bacterium]|nr:S-methyl-5-thioribose-1-phosphate isomerase [Thermoleophilia bacterium]
MIAPTDIIRLEREAVVILDQTRLPGERVERVCSTVAELVAAIRELAVRGAPALGVVGAMGVALAASKAPDQPERFQRTVLAEAAMLATSRPTAINLSVGVQAALEAATGLWMEPTAARTAIVVAAQAFHRAEVRRCEEIGRHGATLFAMNARICSICNAGALATGGYGTALGVIRRLQDNGLSPTVWVPETRPLLQGARLTAWELAEEGIAHQVISDGAVASRFGLGLVDGVVVGADRIAANGDTANKVGTYGLAIVARYHGVPFYVAAPRTTIDPRTSTGAEISIEERPRAELAGVAGQRTVGDDSPIVNPAFDVTPAALIDAIITEDGVLRAPFDFSV